MRMHTRVWEQVRHPRWLFALAFLLLWLGPQRAAAQRLPGEPGAAPGVVLKDISNNTPQFSSVFPVISVSPSNGEVVGVAWRVYSLPINTNAPKESRVAECHVSISADGGKTYRDVNLMSVLRTKGKGANHPELWYCNAPWIAFGPDGTIYAGGSVFTANGVKGPQPKQGRAMVTTSTDNGASWSKALSGITIGRFGPGLAGLRGGRLPADTPWDGSMGLADPQTGVFYSISGIYISASNNKGRTFGTVYQPRSAGWVLARGGSFATAYGTLAAAVLVKSAPVPGAKCPCLALGESRDKGMHWRFRLVGNAGSFSPVDRYHFAVRYPPIAADRMHPGHFAIAALSANQRAIKVFWTKNNGRTWSSASPNPPPAGTIPATAVGMPGIAYSPGGQIVVAWRGFRRAGAYDTYVAMMTSGKFGPTLKLNNEPSEYPPMVQAGNYSFGGGDYTTGVAANGRDAFVVFPYSPYGVVQRTFVAKVGLALLK